MPIQVILPKHKVFDTAKMRQIITNTLNAQAKAIKVDFDVTTQTWSHRPEFKITTPGRFQRLIATDDDIYAMLDAGTRPHVIRPVRAKRLLFTTPFRPKTIPEQIRSNKGSKGNTPVVALKVNHPGTKARKWAKTIAGKWQKQIAAQFQRAIDSSV